MSGIEESTSRTVTLRPPDDPEATVLSIEAETASSEFERNRGLSERPCMLDGWSMLFVHPDGSSELTYSTESMRFPIDIAFLNDEKRVVAIYRDVRPGRMSISSGAPARYVLETSAGELEPLRLDDLAEWQPIE